MVEEAALLWYLQHPLGPRMLYQRQRQISNISNISSKLKQLSLQHQTPEALFQHVTDLYKFS